MADFETFVKKLYKDEYFTLSSDNKVFWHAHAFAHNKNWPKSLDTENFEITGIHDNYIYGYACGDWQEGTTFAVRLDNDNKLFLDMFASENNDSKVIIKHKEAEMVDIILKDKKAIKESIDNDEYYAKIHEYLRELEGEDYGFGRGEKRHGEDNLFKLYVRGKDGVQANIKANISGDTIVLHARCLGFVSAEMSTVSSKDSIKEDLKKIVDWLVEKLHLTDIEVDDNEVLNESTNGDIKTLKALFNEFNKEFFNNELPEVEIKITHKDTDHSKGVAGSFNFHTSIHTNNGENKHYKLSDLKKEKNLEGESQRALDYIKNSAYIEMPKDIVDKGKYYYASVLLHEMVHEYIEFCTNSHESNAHGPDFKRKVDEINKKSKNEWRVPYEEVPPELVSDKPIEERPEDLQESFWSAYYKNGLNTRNLRG